MRNSTRALTVIATDAAHLLMMTLRALQSIVIRRRTRIKLISTRARNCHHRGRISALRRRIILYLQPRILIWTDIMYHDASIISLRIVNRLLRLLTQRTMSSTALTHILLSRTSGLVIRVNNLLTGLVMRIEPVRQTLRLLDISRHRILLSIYARLVNNNNNRNGSKHRASTVSHQASIAMLKTRIVPPLKSTIHLVGDMRQSLRQQRRLRIILLQRQLQNGVRRLDLTATSITRRLARNNDHR